VHPSGAIRTIQNDSWRFTHLSRIAHIKGVERKTALAGDDGRTSPPRLVFLAAMKRLPSTVRIGRTISEGRPFARLGRAAPAGSGSEIELKVERMNVAGAAM
jgi:hypothetical protein